MVYDPVPAMFYLVFYGCGLEGYDALVTSQAAKLTAQLLLNIRGWFDCGGFASAESTINTLHFQNHEDKEAHYIFEQ